MSRWASLWVAIALAAVGTATSTTYEVRLVSSFADILGCELSCRVTAAGWPVQFIFDNPVVSPAGSVSVTGALLGLDNVFWPELFVTFSFWLFVSSMLVWIINAVRE